MHPENRPRFIPSEAEAVLLELYGLTGRASPLPSERDQNFKLELHGGDAYVLKLFHADEEPALVEAQRQVFDRLAQLPRHVFPTLRPTLAGEAYSWATSQNGMRHLAWLTPFLPGFVVASIKEPSPSLLADIGNVLGEMDSILARSPQRAARRAFAWAAQTAPAVIAKHLEQVAPERRGLVTEVLTAFDIHASPRLGELRVSLIHNDVNDHNLLVEHDLLVKHDRVSAVLDFGDMLESYTVCELAHAACYLMLDEPDPLATACALVHGYQAAYPLSLAELSVLYDFIRLRLALSVTLSAYQQRLEPNDPYLSVSEAPAWRLLEHLAHERPGRKAFVEAVTTLGGTP